MEIGSEFEWKEAIYDDDHNITWLPQGMDYVFTFSGRTAIEVALNSIDKKKRALLPSYCCDSMIEPFRKQGIDYSFYLVEQSSCGIRIKINEEELAHADILLICNYFGFKSYFPQEVLQQFHKKGGIIIEDITHSLLSVAQFCDNSDFLVASLRKWGAILDGGYCCSMNSLLEKPTKLPSCEFSKLKATAMHMKTAYLNGERVEKKAFLDMFSQSNLMLAAEYSGRLISTESYKLLNTWDIPLIKEKRIHNAVVLYDELIKLKNVKCLFKISDMDCPLYVPVLVEHKNRFEIRNYLTQHGIYCPIHWTCPKDQPKSELYKTEISLICDQRYDTQDMRRIVEVLKGLEE